MTSVGVCNRCESPALMLRQGERIIVSCACGEAMIPAPFFALAGRPR